MKRAFSDAPVVEQPARRGELLEADEVLALRGARAVPQRVHRRQRVRARREPVDVDLGLVAAREVVRVLRPPVQPRLRAGLATVVRRLVQREVRPPQLPAVVVDVADAMAQPVADRVLGEQPQDGLRDAEPGHHDVGADERAVGQLDARGVRAVDADRRDLEPREVLDAELAPRRDERVADRLRAADGDRRRLEREHERQVVDEALQARDVVREAARSTSCTRA